MITKVTGTLVGLTGEVATLQVMDAFEFAVFIPDFVRRQLQSKVGEVVSLRTMFLLDGNPQQGKLSPKLIGFTSAAEQEFFEAFCSVDGVGMKKALRAMVRPVREVASVIVEQDTKGLAALPGIGPAMAERIVAKLRRKMAKFALLVGQEPGTDGDFDLPVLEETHQALLTLGHSAPEATQLIEEATEGKKPFKTVEALLHEIYKRGKA